jgi:hypothetical protein
MMRNGWSTLWGKSYILFLPEDYLFESKSRFPVIIAETEFWNGAIQLMSQPVSLEDCDSIQVNLIIHSC